MHTISPESEQKFILTYDQAINEGMLKGRGEAILQGMQKGIEKGQKKRCKKLPKDCKRWALIYKQLEVSQVYQT